MKKYLLILAIVLLAGGLYVLPHKTTAGGVDEFGIRLTPSATSALANGSAAITVDLYAYEYRCSQPDAYNLYYYYPDDECAANGHGTGTEVAAGQAATGNTAISASGSGNTLSASSVSPNASGHASFTIKSTVAETKNIAVAYSWNATPVKTIQVTFTAPQAPTPAPAPTPTKKTTTPAPAPAPTAPAAPAAPTLADLNVDGATTSPTAVPEVASSKPVVLAGKVVPNGVVTLTIHSTPKTAIVTADKDGNWSYTITGLTPGSHYVEAAVTDPATKQTSPTAKLLSFTVTAVKVSPVNPVASAPATKQNNAMIAVIIALIVVAILGAGGWYFWAKHRRAAQQAPPTDPGAGTSLPV